MSESWRLDKPMAAQTPLKRYVLQSDNNCRSVIFCYNFSTEKSYNKNSVLGSQNGWKDISLDTLIKGLGSYKYK